VIWNSSDTEGSYRAIFKPAGLPVINDEGDCHGCVSGLVKRRDETYELGHRLDLPVSGVLLLAKGGKRALRLIKALGPEEKEQGKVLKAYLARVRVAVQEGSGDIGGGAQCLDDADWQNMKEIRVKLRWDNRAKKASVVDSSSDGRNTITRVQKLKWDASKGEGLLRVELVTGARQQVRAVLANMGLPIIGDTKYGGGPMFVPTPKQTQPPPTSAADLKEDQVQQSELRLYADDEKGCLLEMLRREKVDWCDKCRWQMEEASKGGTRQGADSLADSICLLSYHYRIPNLGIDVQLPDDMLPDWARS
jgi:23S rRNA-/tRNA-specific pseudouridylate synthase